ncbi:MAG: hypothetical protein Q8L82_04530 [Nitrosomonas sp.]|nr:hypothetical protein [Nitrosomonas sp.]
MYLSVRIFLLWNVALVQAEHGSPDRSVFKYNLIKFQIILNPDSQIIVTDTQRPDIDSFCFTVL